MLNTPSELSDTLDNESLEDTDGTTEELEGSQSVNDEESEALDDQDDEETFQVGDREITLSELEDLEKGNLRQSDYTKKRQAEAQEHRDKLGEVGKLADTLNAQAETLESFLEEDENAIDWDMLSASEVKATEKKFAQRRKKISELRKQAVDSKTSIDQTTLANTNQVVLSHFSEWQGNDELRQKDLSAALRYAKSIGHTDESIALLTTPQDFIPLIEAAKFHKVKNAKPSDKEVVRKPKAVKKKKSSSKPQKSMADIMYGS